MPLTGGPWPIREYMPQVAAAARANLLDAHHPVARVPDAFDVQLGEGLEETRPAGAGIEFGIGPEQRQPAEPARVDAVLLVVEKDAAESGLGAVFQEHAALVAGKSGGYCAALCIGGRGQVEGGHLAAGLGGPRREYRRRNLLFRRPLAPAIGHIPPWAEWWSRRPARRPFHRHRRLAHPTSACYRR